MERTELNKDKTGVFIGAYAPALQDAYFTSIDKGRQMYGVEFQANVTQSLLEGSGRREVSEEVQFVLLTVFCILAGIFYMRLKAAPGAVLCLGLCILGAGGAVCLYHLGWITHPLWIPVSAVVLYLFSLVCHYIRAVRERQALALEKERLATELSLAARIRMLLGRPCMALTLSSLSLRLPLKGNVLLSSKSQ